MGPRPSVGCDASAEWEHGRSFRTLEWKVLEKGRAGVAATCGGFGVVGNRYQGYLVVNDSMMLATEQEMSYRLEAAIKEAERLESAARKAEADKQEAASN